MSKAKVTWQQPAQLELRFTGNLNGNLERLPYLATVIKEQIGALEESLLLDTGNFSGPGKPGPHLGKPQVEVMNHLKFEATVPGRAEATNTRALKEMARMANFPFLASNWRGMGEGDFFQRRLILEKFSTKVVVLGLACPETPQDTELISPEQAIDEALKDIDPQNAVVVVLSQLDYNANRAVALHGNFTKVILAGIAYPGVDQTATIGNSLLAPAVNGPDALGALSVTLSGSLNIEKGTKEN